MSAPSNQAYADELKKKLEELPSVGLKAAGIVALNTALSQTYQDSGEAAYNWSLAWDGEMMQPYRPVRGIAPVGEAYEKRGMGHAEVVMAVMGEEGAKVPSTPFSVRLYNPIPDPAHEFAAGVQTAGVMAVDTAALNLVAKVAIDAYIR